MNEGENGPPRDEEQEEPDNTHDDEHEEIDSELRPGDATSDAGGYEELPEAVASDVPSEEPGSVDGGEKAEETEELLAETAPLVEVFAGEDVDKVLRRLTRRGFLTMAAAGGTGYVGWKWLQTRSRVGGRPWPFRRTLEFNERVAQAYFDPSRLSPTFPADRIDKLRANGRKGLTPDIDLGSWRLGIEGVANAIEPIQLTLDEIRRFPSQEMITELRCIEGWSTIVKWRGVRLVDLMKRFPPPTRDGSEADPINHPERLVRYVAMETPGRGYYVGLDMPSAIHPQTLLVWSMNDQLLNWRHGAPLRLAIPVKYGIKNIKRIGTIRYTDIRPPDYWGKRGYDWYAGF